MRDRRVSSHASSFMRLYFGIAGIGNANIGMQKGSQLKMLTLLFTKCNIYHVQNGKYWKAYLKLHIISQTFVLFCTLLILKQPLRFSTQWLVWSQILGLEMRKKIKKNYLKCISKLNSFTI